jgi:hypothetical protein
LGAAFGVGGAGWAGGYESGTGYGAGVGAGSGRGAGGAGSGYGSNQEDPDGSRRGTGGAGEPYGSPGTRGGSGSTLPFLPPIGGAPREDDREHKRPDWLIETEDIFGIGSQYVAPAVLGEFGPGSDDEDEDY